MLGQQIEKVLSPGFKKNSHIHWLMVHPLDELEVMSAVFCECFPAIPTQPCA